MRMEKHNPCTAKLSALWALWFLSFFWRASSQDQDAMTRRLYAQISNFSAVFGPEVSNHLGFCMKDVDTEWNRAFNFASDLGFLSTCLAKQNDLPKRVCNAAEIKLYFTHLFEAGMNNADYLQPNKNCNLNSWPIGCEPGWACSVGQETVDMSDKDSTPTRTQACQPCCEGFFCPKGLTCMIPCPLGAYCPLAKLNTSAGTCTPYIYHIPHGKQDHTCGGADIWSDVESGSELICPAGSYCPTTVTKNGCSEGHFCRMGSTSELRKIRLFKLITCFQLAKCKANTAIQNIKAYGLVLAVLETVILITVYCCSNHVLTSRMKQMAMSRERTLRSMIEVAHARERWKSATEVVKQSMHKLSMSKCVRQEHKKKSFGRFGQPTIDEWAVEEKMKFLKPKHVAKDFDPPLPPLSGFARVGASSSFTKTKNEYELKKEIAMQHEDVNSTLLDEINKFMGDQAKKRPPLEITFKDLTLTLKGKNKHIIQCVSGMVMPGRMTAIMGPSGAGKTAFVSAISGKISGCHMGGQIYINGKKESINSYKKIIGSVPRDDIVHENLTVEENLLFSSRFRLPAGMPKVDKALVCERVIETLGLRPVRYSLVGTVEQRRISRSQRRRVNIGLEMIAVPSLLILDDLTSGLDRSSCLLIFRALHCEALGGANVCVVVNQPSSSLFKMFDDLILLAKGGLTVYQGSVKEAEAYFAGLGITIPEHANPPDHIIEILEGITKMSGNITREQLSTRWMLHNEYIVPPEKLHLCDQVSTSTHGGHDKVIKNTFLRDPWSIVKFGFLACMMRIFFSDVDLSGRVSHGLLRQYRFFIERVYRQRLREAKAQAFDLVILLLAGACSITFAEGNDETFGFLGYTYTVVAVSLLCQRAALRSFSPDKLQYQRESAAGISTLAYFLAKDTFDMFNVTIKPLAYLSMFYFFNNPRSSFGENYIILFCLVYCVTGIGYALAICLEPSSAEVCSAVLPFASVVVANQDKDSGAIYGLRKLCYTRWALEAFITSNAERYHGVWLISRCGTLMKYGYDIRRWHMCLVYLILTGIASRFAAFFFMFAFNK